jgi:hypothetical protein
MHDGGESLSLLLNGKRACTSRAVYGTERKDEVGNRWTTLSEMTTCGTNIAVKKGDKLALEADFDEVAHPL